MRRRAPSRARPRVSVFRSTSASLPWRCPSALTTLSVLGDRPRHLHANHERGQPSPPNLSCGLTTLSVVSPGDTSSPEYVVGVDFGVRRRFRGPPGLTVLRMGERE